VDGDTVLEFDAFGLVREICSKGFEIYLNKLINGDNKTITCDFKTIDG
jgi:hypothetical protein